MDYVLWLFVCAEQMSREKFVVEMSIYLEISIRPDWES